MNEPYDPQTFNQIATFLCKVIDGSVDLLCTWQNNINKLELRVDSLSSRLSELRDKFSLDYFDCSKDETRSQQDIGSDSQNMVGSSTQYPIYSPIDGLYRSPVDSKRVNINEHSRIPTWNEKIPNKYLSDHSNIKENIYGSSDLVKKEPVVRPSDETDSFRVQDSSYSALSTVVDSNGVYDYCVNIGGNNRYSPAYPTAKSQTSANEVVGHQSMCLDSLPPPPESMIEYGLTPLRSSRNTRTDVVRKASENVQNKTKNGNVNQDAIKIDLLKEIQQKAISLRKISSPVMSTTMKQDPKRQNDRQYSKTISGKRDPSLMSALRTALELRRLQINPEETDDEASSENVDEQSRSMIDDRRWM